MINKVCCFILENKLGYPKKASIPNWSRDFMKYSTVELNVWQKKAVEKALTMPFQLIHGPPGELRKCQRSNRDLYLFICFLITNNSTSVS